VRVGDLYGGYAYYGDAGQNNNPNFYAINLATGAETHLGNAGTLTGGGSFGLWTVVERGGRLYVHTTDNGVRVYTMNSATSLGDPFAAYTKVELDEATGYSGQYWGFDVSNDGRTLILGGSPGLAWELTATADGSLLVGISRVGNNVVLSWPASATNVVIESSPNLSAQPFARLDPQPPVVPAQSQNTASISISGSSGFYRLRK
jgi:hypothetical protein